MIGVLGRFVCPTGMLFVAANMPFVTNAGVYVKNVSRERFFDERRARRGSG